MQLVPQDLLQRLLQLMVSISVTVTEKCFLQKLPLKEKNNLISLSKSKLLGV